MIAVAALGVLGSSALAIVTVVVVGNMVDDTAVHTVVAVFPVVKGRFAVAFTVVVGGGGT